MQYNEFSFYTSNIAAKQHVNKPASIEKIHALVIGETYKKACEQIKAQPTKNGRDNLKRKLLPYFTVSGLFEPFTRSTESVVSHSGLMQIDIDPKENKGQTAAEIKQLICKDEYLLLIFISPTTMGVKAVAKVPAIVERHKDSFAMLETHFKARYGLVIDKQCKDITRPFFVSHDPAAVLKQATEIKLPTLQEPAPANTPIKKDVGHGSASSIPASADVSGAPGSTMQNTGAADRKTSVPGNAPESDFDKKIRHITKLCEVVEATGIDITSDYNFYLNIGFAIADGLGENGRQFYHRICKRYPGYSPAETDKQFEACKKPGGRKWASLFGIAGDYGLVIYPPKLDINITEKQYSPPTPKNPVVEMPAIENESLSAVPANDQDATKAADKPNDPGEGLKFWKVKFAPATDGEKVFKALEIDDINLLNLLKGFGYRRYDVPGGFSFVHVRQNIVCEIQPQNIQDSFSAYLKKLPEKIEKHVTRYDLESLIVKKSETLFGKNRLSWLQVDEPINFNQDTKNQSFVYYQNGYVLCTDKGFTFHQYTSLQKAIWKEQMIDRPFEALPELDGAISERLGDFSKFLWNVSGKDSDRFFSLMTLAGYLLHDFKETKLKAVILTDSKISDGNEGRTGKTLFGKALSKIRNVCELNGKEFKADKSFKYQEAKLSTQVVFLNDAMKHFDLETLYNDITEGITIEKKNQSPVKLKVKYLITTNQTIRTKGASSKDRTFEFEFSDHYSDSHSPKDDFGRWFFSDWDASEWNRFDNFMMYCIALFLENGIVATDPVNLQKRKLIDQTCKQFFDFVEAGNIQPRQEFVLQAICEKFGAEFPDFDFRTAYPTKRFSKWLKLLPDFSPGFFGLKLEFLRKSDLYHYYSFK